MNRPSPAEASDDRDAILIRLRLVTDLIWQVLEAGFLLIGAIVLVYLLLGAGSGAFVLGVVANLTALVTALTPQTFIGVAIVVAIAQVLGRR
jgi:hypothetical protein